MSKPSAPHQSAAPNHSAAGDPGGAKVREYSLEESIAYQIRKTHRYFLQGLQPVLDQYNISTGMWYFLRALWETDGLTQREISERIGLVAPTTVEQLKNMEKRGLIERRRSTEDRRKVHVYLTAEGKALKDRLLPLAPALNQRAVDGLSPGEIGFLRLVLDRMQQNLSGAGAVKFPPPGS